MGFVPGAERMVNNYAVVAILSSHVHLDNHTRGP